MKRFWTRLICCIILLLLTVWVALSPRFSPGLYSQELFRPDWGRGEIKDLRAFQKFENREVWFPTANGDKLHGWYFHNPNATKIFLFHPGNSGDIPKRLPIIEYLLESGASVFIYEPRGFGSSPGSPTIASFCEDGLAAYDHLIAGGFKPEQIVLWGESLGSTVATHVSSNRQVAGIVLQGAMASLERIGKERVSMLKYYPSWLFTVPRMDNAAILSRPHAPLLILHGEKDTVIDISHGEELDRRAIGPKKFVRFPNSGHADVGADLELFMRSVSGFLNSLP